jgi:hypothetical protein
MDKHHYSQGEVATALGKSRVSINEIMSLAGLAPSILDEIPTANVSKSLLVEIARAGGEDAQLDLWNAVQAGANTVRSLRSHKKPATNPAPEPTPIDAAIRAGRRFAHALSAIPAGEGAKFGEIKSLVEQSLSLLDAQGGASKPRRTDMQPGS